MRPDAGRGAGSGIIQAGELGSPAFYCAPMLSLAHWNNSGLMIAAFPRKRTRGPGLIFSKNGICLSAALTRGTVLVTILRRSTIRDRTYGRVSFLYDGV